MDLFPFRGGGPGRWLRQPVSFSFGKERSWEEPEEALFSLNGGVLHCRGCPPGTAGVSLPLGRETLAALRYLLGAEPKRIFSFRVSPETERELGALAEAYLRAQLERGFGSLDYWKLVARTGKAKQETKGT